MNVIFIIFFVGDGDFCVDIFVSGLICNSISLHILILLVISLLSSMSLLSFDFILFAFCGNCNLIFFLLSLFIIHILQ